MEPIICFGQQPNGFFPKRFFAAKVESARELQKKIGGKIVFFYHDSDADYRETITILTDKQSGAEVRLNFTQENKIQKKYSPLYCKRIPKGWQEEISKQLPRFVSRHLIDIFDSTDAPTVADFCLEMYTVLGFLSGMEIMRSSDKQFRLQAMDLSGEYFADLKYENEIVRAKVQDDRLTLHQGGDNYLELPYQNITKEQKNPARDQRFAWMQSVINATHYITGDSEDAYLKKNETAGVEFVKRKSVELSDHAFIEPLT
jgi:hypothetical protein